MKALEYAFNMFYKVYEQKEVQVNLWKKKPHLRSSLRFKTPGEH
jgi:hypothetical protein